MICPPIMVVQLGLVWIGSKTSFITTTRSPIRWDDRAPAASGGALLLLLLLLLLLFVSAVLDAEVVVAAVVVDGVDVSSFMRGSSR